MNPILKILFVCLILCAGSAVYVFAQDDIASLQEEYKNALKAKDKAQTAKLGFEIGKKLIDSKRYKEAAPYLEKASAFYRDNDSFKAEHAQVLFLGGKLQKALKHNKKAISFFEKSFKYSKETKQYAQAKEAAEMLIELLDSRGMEEQSQLYKDMLELLLKSADKLEVSETEKKLNEERIHSLELEQELAKEHIHSLELEQKVKDTQIIFAVVSAFAFLIIGIVSVMAMRRIKGQNVVIEKERKKSDKLLLNILPEETADELKTYERATPKSYDSVSVLFTDFKGFTNISERLSAEEIVHELDVYFHAFDDICQRNGLEKIKTIGDAYMCAGGLPSTNNTHPADAVKAGLEMQAFMEKRKAEKLKLGEEVFELRLGIHTGSVVAGVVGKSKFAYDIWGNTVNLAARMESSGEVGRVNISADSYELVKDQFECEYRGKIEAKNKGQVDMYFVLGKKK